jgi:hypothetical protein
MGGNTVPGHVRHSRPPYGPERSDPVELVVLGLMNLCCYPGTWDSFVCACI